MANELFRKDAVDHLISPEELDQAPRRINMHGWTLVLLTFLMITAILYFSFMVVVPVSIQGQGIIWSPHGVREIMVNTSGNIMELLVSQGQEIHIGDRIALVDQTDLQIELENLREEYAGIESYIGELKRMQQLDRQLRGEHQKELTEFRTESTERYNSRLKRLREQKKQLMVLRDKGHLSEDRYTQILEKLEDVQEQLADFERERLRLLREDNLSDMQLTKELMAQQRSLQELGNKIEAMEKSKLSKGELQSAIDGRIVQINAVAGDFLSPGQSIATVEPIGASLELQALIYASNLEGKLIKPGMPVEMELTAYPKDIYGLLLGSVTSTSPLPASTQGMMRAMKNDLLVKYMSEQGAPFELRVKLRKSDADKSGYYWTSGSDEVRTIKDGMLCTAMVVSRTRKLIDLFLPQNFRANWRSWFRTDEWFGESAKGTSEVESR